MKISDGSIQQDEAINLIDNKSDVDWEIGANIIKDSTGTKNHGDKIGIHMVATADEGYHLMYRYENVDGSGPITDMEFKDFTTSDDLLKYILTL